MTVRLIQRLDRHGRVAAVPLQKSSVIKGFGLSREQCEREAWAIEPGGRKHRGAGAVVAALAWALGCRRAIRAYYLPVARQTGDALYGWIAKNRSRLPGVTPYCQEHPDQCEDS